MARDSLAMAIFFGTYEKLKEKGDPLGPKNIPYLMAAGGLSGILLWTATYPIDVIKTKVQLDPFHMPQFKSSWEALHYTIKHEGVKGLTKGFTPCLIRAGVVSAATVGVFETVLESTQNSFV